MGHFDLAIRFPWWPENAYRVVESFLLVIPLSPHKEIGESLYLTLHEGRVCLWVVAPDSQKQLFGYQPSSYSSAVPLSG
jgi:hypothetical protein